jgi:hypothetical protein
MVTDNSGLGRVLHYVGVTNLKCAGVLKDLYVENPLNLPRLLNVGPVGPDRQPDTCKEKTMFKIKSTK